MLEESGDPSGHALTQRQADACSDPNGQGEEHDHLPCDGVDVERSAVSAPEAGSPLGGHGAAGLVAMVEPGGPEGRLQLSRQVRAEPASPRARPGGRPPRDVTFGSWAGSEEGAHDQRVTAESGGSQSPSALAAAPAAVRPLEPLIFVPILLKMKVRALDHTAPRTALTSAMTAPDLG